MNRQAAIEAIDQAYAASDQIIEDSTNPDDGWEKCFRIMTRLNKRLDDLDRKEVE